MKISTNINSKKNIRMHLIEGYIDTMELIEYLKNVYNSTDFIPDMNVFWDLRKADFSKISSSEVRNVMEFVSKGWGKSGKSKAALIVSKDLDYGLSRMYQIMMDSASKNEISIFKDVEEAEKWIES